MTRRLVLCADDFGQSAAIDRGILRLVSAGRLSAVSCMSNGPAWRDDAAALVQAAQAAPIGVSLGLHFNLSEAKPLAGGPFARLPMLVARAHLGLLPRDAVRAELLAQARAFEQATGLPPAHLDGHQHVHHLPGVRDVVLDFAHAQPGLRVRHTGTLRGPGAGLKQWLIAVTGGRVLGRTLAREDLATSTVLLGAYDFGPRNYRALMKAWLSAVPADGALLFCHPGEPDTATADPIAAARVRELAYLGSEAFAQDLAHAEVRLVPAL